MATNIIYCKINVFKKPQKSLRNIWAYIVMKFAPNNFKKYPNLVKPIRLSNPLKQFAQCQIKGESGAHFHNCVQLFK